jgi:hypothetical protein
MPLVEATVAAQAKYIRLLEEENELLREALRSLRVFVHDPMAKNLIDNVLKGEPNATHTE